MKAYFCIFILLLTLVSCKKEKDPNHENDLRHHLIGTWHPANDYYNCIVITADEYSGDSISIASKQNWGGYILQYENHNLIINFGKIKTYGILPEFTLPNRQRGSNAYVNTDQVQFFLSGSGHLINDSTMVYSQTVSSSYEMYYPTQINSYTFYKE